LTVIQQVISGATMDISPILF